MLRFFIKRRIVLFLFTRFFPLLAILVIPTSILFAQQMPEQAPYDLCEQAKQLEAGDFVSNISNAKATISEIELPEGEPVTCIKTFENDQWFRFTGDTAFTYYEVAIYPRACATPAGMQALIIEADNCEVGDFIYRACANPYKMETLKFFLRKPKHDQNYFIYVDGYDGNVCSYDLELIGHQQNLPPDKHRLLQTDYDNPPPYFEPPSMDIRFQNNEVYLEWGVDAQADVSFFLIERMISYASFGRVHGRVIATIEATNTVGNGQASYRFHDEMTRFQDGESYCYRIVQVNAEGERAYTDQICITADMIESFSTSRIFPQEEKNKFIVLYKNNKKQDLKFSVLDGGGKFLKGLTLQKIKKGDHQFTIDMTAYETGTYFFRVENGEDAFEREFFVE